ncbi:disease resistance protein RUN1-like [Eucalyptus grandis]|uniref:disease resistance protein RUN1-like n=1 Tax=Eucalyptus grandis TaxID=71139 RepID=UPI00192EBFCE|nr:disease resistance protein RUN1-like [Eucalyptus grandis]
MIRKEPPHSEDLPYRASSSSTSPHVGDNGGTKMLKGSDYEVFLSFRGEDTRKGFTDHLYTSLVNAGIRVYRDNNELRVGKEIGPELLYSITQSKISIPIISEDYASSKWCLQELAQMLKCKRSGEQVVLPIFYKVEPSQVRHLKGRFGDAINAHKKNLGQMVVKEWEEALNEVSSLKGWESEKIADGHEAALLKRVVIRVMSELKRLFHLSVPEQLVGTDDRVEQILSKIDANFNGTWIIGIYGMGGIGKTTLAKVVYNKLFSDFKDHCFVADIRERSQRNGIVCLQNELISNVIRGLEVSNVDDGICVLESRCASKKVLVLLDDIDDNTHLNALVGDGSWFKAGSIVIITTRNKSILDKVRASHLYELEKLPSDQSLILFSRHAFRNDIPPSDYKDISYDIVSITGGLPLALQVIASFLCGKPKETWKDTSNKLKRIPDKKVQERLRISYDALDYEEQQIFLDIACFFIGSSKQYLTYMWDACNFYPGKGIEVLSLMSLIKIDKDGTLMMHDQLRDLGREIVRLEHPKKLGNRSRIWTNEEAEDVLESNKVRVSSIYLIVSEC